MDLANLPPAAKLAALIEAGRAANPHIRHGRGHLLHNGAACAIGFAGLALGVEKGIEEAVARSIGMEWHEYVFRLGVHVVRVNDCGNSIESICRSLREGELAKVTA